MRQGRHPGIVALLDTYLDGDPPCLKYEYVAGGDLAGLIRDGGTPRRTRARQRGCCAIWPRSSASPIGSTRRSFTAT